MTKEQARNIVFRQLVDNMHLSANPPVYYLAAMKKQKRGKGKS